LAEFADYFDNDDLANYVEVGLFFLNYLV